MCVNPYIALRRDGTPIPVPCGKCLDCRKQYQTEWIFRLSEESKRSTCPCFITLTYDNEHLPTMVDNETGEVLGVVSKRDWQLFAKRLRKYGGELLSKCRYFAIGEYGSKFNRPHMHAIIIAPNIKTASQLDKVVKQAWNKGFSSTRFATYSQFHYVCKYLNKIDDRHHLVEPFRLYSRSIGLNFLTQKMVDYYLSTFDRTCISGKARIGLPRYYKRKLDEISVGAVVGFKEAGLCYSDMLEDIKPVPGTKYFYFKYFTEHFEEIYKDACVHVLHDINGCDEKFEELVCSPTRQQVWRYFVRVNKRLHDIVLEDERLLSECKIRNKLSGYVSTDFEMCPEKILKEAI